MERRDITSLFNGSIRMNTSICCFPDKRFKDLYFHTVVNSETNDIKILRSSNKLIRVFIKQQAKSFTLIYSIIL